VVPGASGALADVFTTQQTMEWIRIGSPSSIWMVKMRTSEVCRQQRMRGRGRKGDNNNQKQAHLNAGVPQGMSFLLCWAKTSQHTACLVCVCVLCVS